MAAERARELIDYVFQPNSSAPGRDCCLLDSNGIIPGRASLSAMYYSIA